MAQTGQIGQVTPADELRELLAAAEKRVANVRGSGESVGALLKELDRIAALWPELEAQGVDLRPEAGRWETLQVSVNRRAEGILYELRALGGIGKMRRAVHPEGADTAWWRLDDFVRANRGRRAQKIGRVLGGLVVLGAVLYFGLRLLFPVDPKVAEAARRTGQGEILVQQHADLQGALAEFVRAAELTPDDPEVWLRIGAVQEKMGDPAAQETYGRAQTLVADDVYFRQMRAAVYLGFAMIDQADQDVRVALAAKPDDPYTWYQLASIYEARGQIGDAIDALVKVSEYSSEAGPVELSAMARYRQGILMQQFGFQEQVGSATITPAP